MKKVKNAKNETANWKVQLYFKNQYIKTKKCSEEFNLIDDVFIVWVIGKKHLFGTMITKLCFKFYALKYRNEKKKEIHIEVIEYTGKEIN